MKKKLLTLLLMVGLVICFLPFSAEAAGKTKDSAETIGMGTEYSGTLKYEDLTNYWKVNVPAAGTLSITVSTTDIEYGYLYLTDANNTDVYITPDRFGIKSTNQITTKVNLKAGSYYIQVKSGYLMKNEKGSYKLKASFTKATETQAETTSWNNDVRTKAKAINFNKVVKGFLGVNDTVDFYKIVAPSHIVMKVEVNPGAMNGYLYIETYNKDGGKVGYSFSPSNTKKATTITLTKGTYYIGVNSSKYHTGAYKIKCTYTKVGWNKAKGGKYWYQTKDQYRPAKRFYEINKKTYYFNASGYRVTGLKKIKDYYYLFNKNGVMLTGWRSYNKKRYYFQKSLGYAYTGERLIGNDWYYFNKKGQMQKGWIKQDGYYYYYGSTGAQVHGWAKIGGKWYWFYSSGRMYSNGYRYEGSKKYYFNKDGVCTNR